MLSCIFDYLITCKLTNLLTYLIYLLIVKLQVLGLGLGVDFAFTWDNNDKNNNNDNDKNSPHLNFLKGTLLGDMEQNRDKG